MNIWTKFKSLFYPTDWCFYCGHEFVTYTTRGFFSLWNTRPDKWLIPWILPITWFHNLFVCHRYWPGRLLRDRHVERCGNIYEKIKKQHDLLTDAMREEYKCILEKNDPV